MDIENKVFDLLKELSGNETIKLSDTLKNEIALDSLGMVTLLVEIEDVFQIELDESDMNPFELITVSDVVELVKRYHDGQKTC